MFTDIFGNTPRVRFLDFLADHPDFDYTISQMAEFADIARPTVYKLVAELQSQDMLTFTRSVGDSRFYRLNVANPRIVSMLQMDFEGINKELAATAYEEMPDSEKEPPKSRAGSHSLRRRMASVRADPRRAVRSKRPKSFDRIWAKKRVTGPDDLQNGSLSPLPDRTQNGVKVPQIEP